MDSPPLSHTRTCGMTKMSLTHLFWNCRTTRYSPARDDFMRYGRLTQYDSSESIPNLHRPRRNPLVTTLCMMPRFDALVGSHRTWNSSHPYLGLLTESLEYRLSGHHGSLSSHLSQGDANHGPDRQSTYKVGHAHMSSTLFSPHPQSTT